MLIIDDNKMVATNFTDFKLPGGINYFNKYKEFISVYIHKVIFNKPATIILWSDGTKTISKCHKDDIYNKEFGFYVCILKKIFGADFKELCKYFINTKNVITLADIRKCTK